MIIFNTKWKKRYEKHRSEIETLGWDAYINQPLDILPALQLMESLRENAINQEATGIWDMEINTLTPGKWIKKSPE